MKVKFYLSVVFSGFLFLTDAFCTQKQFKVLLLLEPWDGTMNR